MQAEQPPAFGYVRVSTERQAGETVTSLADQEAALRALAARLGADLATWYRDEGASGATVEARPAFSRLLAECAAQPRAATAPGYVLVLNASRFGRFDDPDQAAAIRYTLKRAGWLVRFAESDDTEDLIGRSVMRAVGDAQASEYRRNIIRNAQRGKKGAAELGYWTSREPFGYRRRVVHPVGRERILEPGTRKADDEKAKLTPGPDDEVTLLRWLFDAYASGTHSMGQLVTALRARVPGRHWSRATVRALLVNPAYVGDTVIGRRSGALMRQGVWRTDPAAWQTIADTHPPLVSRATFAAVARRLGQQHRPSPKATADYLLTGFVTCATCGHAYVGGGFNGRLADGTRLRHYRDAGHIAGRCPGPAGTVSKHLLESALVDAMAKELRRPAVLAAIRRAASEDAPPAPRAAERRALALELRRAEQRRDRLVQAIADGTMTADEARTALASAREAIARLRGAQEPGEAPPRDAAALTAERDRLTALALDFPRVAKALTGAQLRDVLAPWLAGAVFDKSRRELVLQVRRVPVSLVAGISPGRD